MLPLREVHMTLLHRKGYDRVLWVEHICPLGVTVLNLGLPFGTSYRLDYAKDTLSIFIHVDHCSHYEILKPEEEALVEV